MLEKFKVSMPRRDTLVYEKKGLQVVFEVEVLSDGIVLYTNSPEIIEGKETELSREIAQIKDWLEKKFTKVEIDNSPPKTFKL